MFVTFSERFLQIALANLAIRKVDCCVMVVHLKGSVENVECGVWKIRSVENAECGKCGVWKMRSVESAECEKCRVWKIIQFLYILIEGVFYNIVTLKC